MSPSSASSTRTATAASSSSRTARRSPSPRASTIPRGLRRLSVSGCSSPTSSRVLRIDKQGQDGRNYAGRGVSRDAAAVSLNDIAADETGRPLRLRLRTTSARAAGAGIFRIDPKKKVTLVADAQAEPGPEVPNGVAMDGMSFLLLGRFPVRASCTASKHRRRHVDEAGRRLRLRRWRGRGTLRPALRQRQLRRQGLRHPSARRQAGAVGRPGFEAAGRHRSRSDRANSSGSRT